jgi:ABC-2 type transport system permease protein
MSRTWAVVKHEFLEMIRTRAFLVGTILGPLFMLGLVGFQILMATRTGGSERTIVVVDRSGMGIGQATGQLLSVGPGDGRAGFRVEYAGASSNSVDDDLRAELLARVKREEIDGFLWIPEGVLDGAVVSYSGSNAASLADMERVRGSVQTAVQGGRLEAAGIDAGAVGNALRRVPFEARNTDEKAASGSTGALIGLTYALGFGIYVVVLLYGNSVLRGVLEEKRERIVEVVVSSIRSDQLLVGKVLGIGGAGVFQVLIWAGFAALALTRGGDLALRFGAAVPELPTVPLSVGVTFIFYFATGFLLYATMYAAIGAIATTDQEAQQLQMPVIMLLVLALSMMGAVMMDPNGTAAVVGSLIPFTAPVVMPMRAVGIGIPAAQLAGSMALLGLTVITVLWVAARIYRIGILATGRRPTMREVWRWVRAGG